MDEKTRERIELNWLGLGDVSQIETTNPLAVLDQELGDPAYPVLDLMRKPEYFAFTFKQLFGENKKLHPIQLAVLRELWIRPFPMLIGCRGFGKTWLLALYSLLRAIFDQGSKVVIVGAAFRQSKMVFEYVESFWEAAPVLKDLVGPGTRQRPNGPRREMDKHIFRIGDSTITALPLGNGQKIRGQRASHLVVDEFASVQPVEVYENVVKGFTAVSVDPIEKVERLSRIKILRELGFEDMAKDEEFVAGLSSNQHVLSGTAYWAFNHFYRYWRRYKDIIESQGDPEKLAKAVGEEGSKLDPADYCIMRLPYDILPDGMMDEKTVSSMKATTTKANFLVEMGACWTPGCKVITTTGLRDIEDIRVGDLVLTHKGRFRPVTEVMSRHYEGPVIKYRTLGYSETNGVTPEHPHWVGDEEWVNAEQLGSHTYLANLKELSGKTFLDLTEWVERYRVEDGKMYPISGKATLTEASRMAIRDSNKDAKSLAKEYGVSLAVINYARRDRRIPKNAINRIVPLNYEFGLVVGYYASEGWVGDGHRITHFALDGHHDQKLTFFVDQLSDAIRRSLGVEPSKYHKDAVMDVTINQRLAGDLFHALCPGRSHTKIVRHDVLFSNEEFLKGFVVGYWNGDGHMSAEPLNTASVHCVNPHLLTQTRLALSYFGISSTLRSQDGYCKFMEMNKTTFYLNVNGENSRKFRRVFYAGAHKGLTHQRIVNDGEKSCLPITLREEVHYTGLVHNLEVADDHSYSLPNATVHNCFSGETPVLTATGARPISEVNVGDLVLTHRGRFRPVTAVMNRDYLGFAVHYAVPGHPQTIHATPEHPYWRGGDDFTSVKECTENTFLAVPTHFPGPTSFWVKDRVQGVKVKPGVLPEWTLNEDLGFLVGCWAASGYNWGHQVIFEMQREYLPALQRLREICGWLLGDQPREPQAHGQGTGFLALRVSSRLLEAVLSGLTLDGHVDPAVLWATPEFLWGFVRGCCLRWEDTVGWVKSQDLAYQLQLALAAYGVVAFVDPLPDARGYYRIFLEAASAPILKSPARPALASSPQKHSFLFKKVQLWSGVVHNLEVAEDHSYSLVNATVHNCFPVDSDGFFKRSLIETCVVGKPDNPIMRGDGVVSFEAVLRGHPKRTYMMGVDPAAKRDHFAIVIVELWPDHRRVVYCWTTTLANHRAKLQKGLTHEKDYYAYVAKKIRELLALFPCERIAMDAQGGGGSVVEALWDPDKIGPGEEPILPVVDEDHPAITDNLAGNHLIELVQFARADWTTQANHGLKKDFEDKAILFPEYDTALLGRAAEEDALMGRVAGDAGEREALYDTLEDCILEIEALKDELATIVVSETPSGREHWDVQGGKNSTLLKDRYSALLMANMVARQSQRALKQAPYGMAGGFAQDLARQKELLDQRGAYRNPAWYEAVAGADYGVMVRRGNTTGDQ